MMTPYPQHESDAPPPFVLEGSGSAILPAFRFRDAIAQKIPAPLRAMAGYLVAGIALGLVLVIALTLLSDGGHRKGAAAVVTDEVVHLHAKDIGDTCWRGSANASLAKLSVAMEVGLDGKVRSASATGDSPVMRGCVESHVKRWEFLPQASPSQMVLPFEVDPR